MKSAHSEAEETVVVSAKYFLKLFLEVKHNIANASSGKWFCL